MTKEELIKIIKEQHERDLESLIWFLESEWPDDEVQLSKKEE